MIAVQFFASIAHGGEEPWASDVLKACDVATAAIAKAEAQRTALKKAGMPEVPEGDPNEVLGVWLAHATPEVFQQCKDLDESEATVRLKILDLYFISSIGDPIFARQPDRILPDAATIVSEYRQIVGKSGSDRFQDVFWLGLEKNLLRLKGPYYRQVVSMFRRHARIHMFTTMAPDDLSAPDVEEQQKMRRVFGRWYFIDLLQYDCQWNKARIPLLLPSKGYYFNLSEDTF